MQSWTVEQWAQIKAWAQLLLAALIVVVWLLLVIERGWQFTLEDVMRLITLVYFSGTGLSNIGKFAAYKNGS